MWGRRASFAVFVVLGMHAFNEWDGMEWVEARDGFVGFIIVSLSSLLLSLWRVNERGGGA